MMSISFLAFLALSHFSLHYFSLHNFSRVLPYQTDETNEIDEINEINETDEIHKTNQTDHTNEIDQTNDTWEYLSKFHNTKTSLFMEVINVSNRI